MDTLSPITTKKRIKASHSRKETSCKIVAFNVLRSLQRRRRSEREIAALLEIPNSTMQSWRAAEAARKAPRELQLFFSTPCGTEFLQRVVMAAHQSMHFGCGGIRSLQEFLHLSQLNHFVASSEGALQDFSVRYEEHIIKVGEAEEKKLAGGMGKKKITAVLDEMFRGKHPCLVAIEAVSNYILLEKFTDDRKAETWGSVLKPRLNDLNLELQQVVSDQGSGIRACAEALGARHVTATRNLKRYGFEIRRERSKKVREAKKELGSIHHPINMKTGKLQTADDIKSRFDEQLNIIETCAREAELASSCKKRLAKARRTFDSIVGHQKFFFTLYMALVTDLGCDESQERFFNETIFPLSYLKAIWGRLPRKEKDKLVDLRRVLERKLAEAPYSEEIKQSWIW